VATIYPSRICRLGDAKVILRSNPNVIVGFPVASRDKKTLTLLYVFEGLGLALVVIFLIAYLGGLPTTNVLHKYLAFRIPLGVLGALVLALSAAAVVMYSRQKPA